MEAKKPCTACGINKPLSDYSNHPHGLLGKQAMCRECNNKKNKAAYWGNLDVMRERSRLRAIEEQRLNPDKRNASRRAWDAANQEASKAAKRAWRLANKDKLREAQRAWHAKNKEENKSYTRGYRARRRNSFGRHSAKDIHRMLIEQSGRCNHCLAELVLFDVDHLVPLSRGGSNGAENLQLLCPSCNRTKGNKTHEEFLRYSRA